MSESGGTGSGSDGSGGSVSRRMSVGMEGEVIKIAGECVERILTVISSGLGPGGVPLSSGETVLDTMSLQATIITAIHHEWFRRVQVLRAAMGVPLTVDETVTLINTHVLGLEKAIFGGLVVSAEDSRADRGGS